MMNRKEVVKSSDQYWKVEDSSDSNIENTLRTREVYPTTGDDDSPDDYLKPHRFLQENIRFEGKINYPESQFLIFDSDQGKIILQRNKRRSEGMGRKKLKGGKKIDFDRAVAATLGGTVLGGAAVGPVGSAIGALLGAIVGAKQIKNLVPGEHV